MAGSNSRTTILKALGINHDLILPAPTTPTPVSPISSLTRTLEVPLEDRVMLEHPRKASVLEPLALQDSSLVTTTI
jgi:hypothetical protein